MNPQSRTAAVTPRRVDLAGDLPRLVPDLGVGIHGVDAPLENAQRAHLAALTVAVFAGSCGMLSEHPTLVIKDLLTDLGHLCDLLEDADGTDRVDFVSLADRALDGYREELEGGR